MPIEIRELVIRAQVDPCNGTIANGSNNSLNHQQRSAEMAEGLNQAEIVRACVQEVLRVLEEKRER